MQVSSPNCFVRSTDKIKGKEQKQAFLRFLSAKFSINTGATIPIDAQIKRSNFCRVETLKGLVWH